MLDWLKTDPRETPTVAVGDAELPIVIRRNARAKRMILRLAPDGREVRVTVPNWGRTADALDFARTRRDWLEGQLAALPRAEPVSDGSTLTLRGKPVLVEHDAAARRKPELEDSIIRVGGPASSLPARLKRWLEGEARALLAEDLVHYCRQVGKAPPPLALSNARRRWGSCAPNGAIRINWRLIMAPDFVRRSVVAHEVAHLVHFDHSPRFHALLGELFEGDIDTANRWLKRDGRALYHPFG